MVDYIGVGRVLELVSRIGTARFMEALATEIESDYRRWMEFDKSPRHATHSPVGVIELMPTSDGRLYSFKYVNGHPKNTANGLLTVTAFGVLSDVQSGYPLLLSEMTFTTALRTAAMSALAACRLARAGSRVMALIGNGAQSEFQAVAFHHMVGVRELRLYDVDLRATLKLERNLLQLGLSGLRVVRCDSTAEAVSGADILTTVTADKCNAKILTPEMIQPGMHINDELGVRQVLDMALADLDSNTHLHVSFDVDFLDPEIAPGVGTTVPGGPSYREAQLCMEMIADTGLMASLDVVELNPALDVRNKTATLAVDLIESLFGKSTLIRRRFLGQAGMSSTQKLTGLKSPRVQTAAP